MKKTAALALVALASLLCACNPPWAAAADGGVAIDELCLQDGFTPCKPHAPTDLTD